MIASFWAAGLGLAILAGCLMFGGELWRAAGNLRTEETTACRLIYLIIFLVSLFGLFGLILLVAALGEIGERGLS